MQKIKLMPLDIQKNNGIVCSSCDSTEVYPISLCGKILTTSMPNDKGLASIVLCSRCTLPMIYEPTSTIGIHYLCHHCLSKSTSEMIPNKCFCGIEYNPRGKMLKTFLAYSEQNKLALFSVCEKHEWAIPIREIVPISTLYQLINRNKK